MNAKKILVILFLSVIGFSSYFYITQSLAKKENIKINLKSENSQLVSDQQNPQLIPINKTRIFFVGDIMLDRSVRKSVNNNFAGDYNRLFDNLNELKSADIVFGNLEGAVSDKGNNVGSKYSFRMDPIVLPALKNAGFTIVSFANNHVGDWNIEAFKDTLNNLNENNILKVGAGFSKDQAVYPTIIEKNNVKFGFIGFSDVGPNWLIAGENTPGILSASDLEINDIIKNAKSKCDVLIVSFHWGVEYQTIHNKHQENLAHMAIDNGADIVVGHHPHVMQDIENYKDKLIIYSLGNFIFDQYFSGETMKGMLFETIFNDKVIEETKQKIIKLNKFYQPEGIYLPSELKNDSKENKTNNPCPTPKKTYDDQTYLNVDQNISLQDTTYIPNDLVKLDKTISTSTICLKKDASDALIQMAEAAKKDGYTIKATSGFRDYDTQKSILDRNIKSGNKNATKLVAKPGYSEHQLGVAVDLTSPSISYASATTRFQDTPEAKWLEENASNYGFIESYPKGKEEVTGYLYEAWHYRYVGLINAQEILKSEKTTNQFFTGKIAENQKY